MAKVILLLLTMMLGGCFWTKETTKYITAECPEPRTIERPDLDTDHLKEGDGPDVVIQAHRTTIKALQKYSLEQETILNGYRKKTK